MSTPVAAKVPPGRTTGTVHYLSTLDFPADWLDRLRAISPDVEVTQLPARSAADVPAEIWRRTTVLHTSAVFPTPEQAPALRWVQLDTSGVDHLVASPLWRSPVAVTTIGGVSPVSMAEYVLFAILGFAHRLPQLLDVRDSHRWPDARERFDRFAPARVSGATLGILGYGRIGREVGRLAAAHGMRVLGITRSGTAGARRSLEYATGTAVPAAAAGEVTVPAAAGQVTVAAAAGQVTVAPPSALRDVLGQSDYLVVVCPLTPETRNLLDSSAIAAMKPGSVLINVARGGIVAESALAEALRSGHLAGAVLDVFDAEPLPPDSPWWEMPNVFATPHVSGLAGDYLEHVAALVADNLGRLQRGEPLLNLVDWERGY